MNKWNGCIFASCSECFECEDCREVCEELACMQDENCWRVTAEPEEQPEA